MSFEEIAKKYKEKFGEMPPILSTLDTENEDYLGVLEEAIEIEKPLTRNELGEIFMTNEKAYY